ncbi:MAG: AmmeMemoRadiSam system radical SAM enzyme [Bacillota bacterium]
MELRKARFWEKQEDGAVRCRLCPHGCVILSDKTGVCGVREVRDGVLYSMNYGLLSSLALDPVEKKPLYHFHPGSYLFSVGSYGCNLGCLFCQNWQISQERPNLYRATPSQVVDLALEQKRKHPRVTGIAYTYNEPTVFMEFILDTAALAKQAGLSNVLITNGYISTEALSEALPLVDALNIDVKGWTEEFYRRTVKGRLAPVMRAVEQAVEQAWVEVTYLVIPGENDRDEDVGGLARWLHQLSPSIPLHLSRYFPNYKFESPATPVGTLERLRDIAREHLHYVYIGNAWKKGYADTLCPECHTLLLARGGLELEESRLEGGSCPKCGRELEMRGEVWVNATNAM